MAAIADLDDFVNRMSGGSSGTPENLFWWKGNFIGGTKALGWADQAMLTLWHRNGFPTGAAVVSTSVEILSSSTAGALPFTNATGGREKLIVGAESTQPEQGNDRSSSIFAYDRLSQVLLDNQLTSGQTVGGAITRYTDGAGNFIFMEMVGYQGSTDRFVTIDYTNQAGTTSRTATSFLGVSEQYDIDGGFMMVGLQDGDTGVRSIQDVTLNLAAGTANDFVVGIGHPLFMTVGSGPAEGMPSMATGAYGTISKLVDNACIAFTVGGNALQSFNTGAISTIEA